MIKFIKMLFTNSLFQIILVLLIVPITWFFLGYDNPAEEKTEDVIYEKTGINIDLSDQNGTDPNGGKSLKEIIKEILNIKSR